MTSNAFVAELMQLQDALFKYALTLTCDYEKAKDLKQETLVRAIYKREYYTEGTNLQAWASTIMKNIFINEYRKYFYGPIMIPLENVYNLGDNNNAAEDIFDIEVINKVIRGGLNENDRQIFALYITEYKYEEIAKELKIPLGTVKSRLHSIKEKLREELRKNNIGKK